MDTLLLDRTPWDLALDALGNIALATEPYAVIQDVASACRLFTNELYYGGSQGIPYFREALGEFQPTQVLKARIVQAALGVPGVLTAKCFLTSDANRVIGGQVQITTADGPFTVTI
jgi:hypothetical protein